MSQLRSCRELTSSMALTALRSRDRKGASGTVISEQTFPHRGVRVVHVGKFYPPHRGGMESHLAALCGALRSRVELEVLVAGDSRSSSREMVDGVSVRRLGTWLTAASTCLSPGLPLAIRDARPDLLHLHLPNPAAVLSYFSSGYRGPVVVTYHSDVVRKRTLNSLYTPWVHRLLRRCSAIIVASPNYLASSRVLERHRDRCHVIPFGIRCEEFTQCAPGAVADERLRFGPRLVLGVGRMVYYKGFQYLIRAMARVEGRLILVGEGPQRKELEELTASLGLGHKVVFTGSLSPERLLALYHAASVFVLPSVARSEAFGIVQIEAMSAGKPVINTALDSGVPFVSRDGETGFTVPPADPSRLAAAITQLLENGALRAAYGKAALVRAQQEFHLDLMVKRTLHLYQQVLRQTGTDGRMELARAEPAGQW